MTTTQPKKLWFRAKHYGIGRVPHSREGRSVLAAYLIVTLGSFQLLLLAELSDQQIALWHGIILLISTILLLVISHRKGEKAGRNRGRKK